MERDDEGDRAAGHGLRHVQRTLRDCPAAWMVSVVVPGTRLPGVPPELLPELPELPPELPELPELPPELPELPPELPELPPELPDEEAPSSPIDASFVAPASPPPFPQESDCVVLHEASNATRAPERRPLLMAAFCAVPRALATASRATSTRCSSMASSRLDMRKRDRGVVAELAAARDAVKREPSDPRHWVALGVVLSRMRHWDEAVKALQRGVELKPAYAEADARMFLADALVGAGRRAEASRQWQIVVEMKPTYPSYDEPMTTARRKLAGPSAS